MPPPSIKHGSSTPPSRSDDIFLFDFSHHNCFRYNHRTGSLESCRGFDAVDLYDSKNGSSKINKGANDSDAPATKSHRPHPKQHHSQHQHSKPEASGSQSQMQSSGSSNILTTIHEYNTKQKQAQQQQKQAQQQQQQQEQEHEQQQQQTQSLLFPPTLEPLLQSAAEWHFREYHSNKALLAHRVEVRQAHVVWKDAGAGAMELLDVPLTAAEWQLGLVRARGFVDHIYVGYATHERETTTGT